MNCVKKYDVGQIKLEPYCISDLDELPLFVYYTHELPLLSFGDVQHTVNLSLVFNYAGYRTEKRDDSHPFFIAPGYKLNLQKHLLYDANGLPTALVEESGKTVGLIQAFGGVFTFDDESQRILRRTECSQKPPLSEGSADPLYDYIVEYPDFSKEKYNESGRITAVYDKYSSSAFLTYSYNGYGQLTAITFRGSKTITLDYAANRLKHITYADCSSCFNYNFDGTLNNIEHYTGVKYNFILSKAGFDFEEDLLESDFTIEAVSAENNTTVSYAKELKWTSGDTIELIDMIGSYVKNKVSYKFSSSFIYGASFQFVDITDNNGVVTRAQLYGSKTMYSYEVKGDPPQFVGEDSNIQFVGEDSNIQFVGDVTLYDAMGSSNNSKVIGVQTLQDGFLMNDCGGNQWQKEVSEDVGKDGYYIVSGWIKSDNEQTSYAKLYVAEGPVNTSYYEVNLMPIGEWKYFSIVAKLSPNTVYFRTSGEAGVSTRDVRLAFQETGIAKGDNKLYTNLSEYVLLQKSNPNKEIPFKDVTFSYYVGTDKIDLKNEDGDQLVTFFDIMRYKLRKKREGLSNEIYYDNCAEIVVGATNFQFWHDDIPHSISDFDLGIRVYSKGKKSVTRIQLNEDSQDNIVRTYTLEGTLISTDVLDNNLDVVESTNEGVTTEYSRNPQGLIISEKVSGLYRRDTSYTDTLITVNDVNLDNGAIVSATRYHINPTWGCVYKVERPDGSVISDTYDGDMSTLLHKTFSKDNKEKVHHFNYPDEQSLEVSDDTLQYAFENDFWVSGRQYVKKLGVPIEYHERSMNDRTFKDAYPDYLDPEYECSGTFDKYGRLTTINGMLEYSYSIDPRWTYLHQNQQTHIMNEYNRVDDGELHHSSAYVDGKDAMLSQTKDLLTAETTKYGYYGGKLTAALTYDNSDFVLSREVFVYDKADRLKEHNFNYNLSNYDPITGNHVGSDIGYVKSDDNPLADNQVASYSYKVGGAEKAKTENTYDAYKRIINKKYTVGGKVFTKGIEYAQTRIGALVDSVGGTTSYEYDPMGRICQEKDGDGNILKSYTYDEFGQLIREDNKTLDKTFVYEYNNIGNVTCVKEYDYFVTEEELPGCYRGIVYEYDAECPDKLTTFDGNVIEYNSIGCTSKYKDENYEWANGKLSKIHRSTFIRDEEHYTTRTFTYDGYGRRTQKHSVTGVNYSGADAVNSYSHSHTNDYTYDNSGRLIREVYTRRDSSGTVSETRELVCLYDESEMIGVMLNSQPYYYHRNLQGDVIAIYDANGEKQVEYSYDAWGNCETVYGENDELAYLNPIRYRGYYYDTETGLYYLNARYYSPEWRRFISSDAVEYIDPETPNGLNLYAYCNNDPINFVDPSGNGAITLMVIVGVTMGVLFAGGGNIASQLVNNGGNWNSLDWGSVINESLIGGALALSLALGVAYLGPVVAGVAGASIKSALLAFGVSTSVSVTAGVLGYAIDEKVNSFSDLSNLNVADIFNVVNNPNHRDNVFAYGVFTAIQSMFYFQLGGHIGAYGTIGTKGKPFLRAEWIRKFIHTQIYKIPFDKLLDNLYEQLGI